MPFQLAITLLGALLIALTFFDVFLTVLHPQAESPFSSRLQTALWRLMRLMARPMHGRARHRFLGLAVPTMIVALVAAWVGLLVVSFGLIYSAWIGAPGVFRLPDGLTNPGWGDAFYFSGETLGTVGYGDFQPVHPLLRLVSTIEGFSGIAVISMSIAYVLELYPVLQRNGVLAVLLNEETAGQVSGLPLLLRYLRKGNFEALASLVQHINIDLLSLAEAHRRLPVLHYGHPAQVERSFLRVLLVVQNLVGTLRYGMAGGEGKQWSDDPRVRALEDSLFFLLYTLGSSLHLPLASGSGGEPPTAEIDEAFSSLCDSLKRQRLPTPSDTAPATGSLSEYDIARQGFARFHISINTTLLSYLRNSGYTYAEATANAARPQRLVDELEHDER